VQSFCFLLSSREDFVSETFLNVLGQILGDTVVVGSYPYPICACLGGLWTQDMTSFFKILFLHGYILVQKLGNHFFCEFAPELGEEVPGCK
jgi:hypothetical protein